MSQRCPRCRGNKQLFERVLGHNSGLPYRFDCPTCKASGQVSTDFMTCDKCQGQGGTFDRFSGNYNYPIACQQCNKTGIIKTPQAIQRDNQLAQQRAIQEAERKATTLRLQKEKEKVTQANLIIQQRNQQISTMKQRESILINQIEQNRVKMAEMERLGQQQHQNFIQLLQLHVKLQGELIELRKNN